MLERLREALGDHRPLLLEHRVRTRAAVALVVSPDEDGEGRLLMIERADVPGDRWSGQIAFPGGRAHPSDGELAVTAERETREELAVDLRTATLLGRLDDLAGTNESIIVSAFVYGLEAAPPLRPQPEEVKRGFWRRFTDIQDPANHVVRPFEYAGEAMSLPSLRVLPEPAPLLWGLSYRFLELLMERIERPIPAMPWTTPPT